MAISMGWARVNGLGLETGVDPNRDMGNTREREIGNGNGTGIRAGK
jgi:hypothetical protein